MRPQGEPRGLSPWELPQRDKPAAHLSQRNALARRSNLPECRMSRYAAVFLLLAPCFVLLHLPDSRAQPAPKIKDIAEGRNAWSCRVAARCRCRAQHPQEGRQRRRCGRRGRFAMAVTYPAAGNIGGGGFMVIHPPKASRSSSSTARWHRARRPRRCTPRTTASTATGRRRAGTVRGLASGPPALRQAGVEGRRDAGGEAGEEGFVLDETLASSLSGVVASSREFEELQRVFGKDGGKVDWKAGDRFVQKDLGKSLRLIAEQGPDAFYKGPIAKLIAEEMQRGKGAHFPRRPRQLQGERPHADPRHLPRLRRLRRAAAVVGRHLPRRDAPTNPRKTSTSRNRAAGLPRRCT